jgi:hypothetical protein
MPRNPIEQREEAIKKGLIVFESLVNKIVNLIQTGALTREEFNEAIDIINYKYPGEGQKEGLWGLGKYLESQKTRLENIEGYNVAAIIDLAREMYLAYFNNLGFSREEIKSKVIESLE